MNFGERLKQVRTSQGMSIEELSELANVNRRTIELLEGNPEKLPNGNNLKGIAIALNVSTDWLLGLISSGDQA